MQWLAEHSKVKCLVQILVYNSIHTSATINLKEVVYFVSEDDATYIPSRFSSVHSEMSEVGNSFAEDRETDGMCMLWN